MGVSQVVAFSLVALVAFSTLIPMAAIYQKSQNVYNDALSEFHDLQIASQDTNLKITNVTNSGQELMINVTNTGSTNLYDYTHFTLIVNYYQNVSDAASHSLSLYAYSNSLAPYQWTSVNGIIFPSTSGVFKVTLPGMPYLGEPVVIVLTTSVGPSSVWSGEL